MAGKSSVPSELMSAPVSTSDPRICIVGAGNLSTSRIYPYIGSAGAQLVGVCDLDQEKAARNARRFGGAVYGDMEKMLAEQKPDGVIVCVGPKGHSVLAPRVMRLGYPVYTEKPPAESAVEALTVARVAKETGLLCTTAFKKRYNHAYTRAKSGSKDFRRRNCCPCPWIIARGTTITRPSPAPSCWISPSISSTSPSSSLAMWTLSSPSPRIITLTRFRYALSAGRSVAQS